MKRVSMSIEEIIKYLKYHEADPSKTVLDSKMAVTEYSNDYNVLLMVLVYESPKTTPAKWVYVWT